MFFVVIAHQAMYMFFLKMSTSFSPIEKYQMCGMRPREVRDSTLHMTAHLIHLLECRQVPKWPSEG